MTRDGRTRQSVVVALVIVAALLTGGWILQRMAPTPARGGPEPSSTRPAEPTAAPPAVRADAAPEPGMGPGPGPLLIPVAGVRAQDLRDTFHDPRGTRAHEAIDIMAPTGTPVFAVDDGTVAKRFASVPGGTTLYQFDPSGRWAYYYAHLDRYADGIVEGKAVRRGDVVGYVGSTGNVPPGAPHLHFAVFRLGPEKRWWQGEAVNPFPFLKSNG